MKAGLLGRKLGHSLSPQIHRLFGDYEYRLYEREPEEVEAFVRSGELDFFNVTIPYKKVVADLCDELSPIAARLGNVNLVVVGADGKLRGDNTDAFGVERMIDAYGIDVAGRNCAILGAGGAATTVKAVLESRGASVVNLVKRGEVPHDDAWLIVNATPVGMYPDIEGTRIDIEAYPNCGAVLDLVYNPSPTKLVRQALACGKIAADGLVMLIAQAYRAFELVSADEEKSPNRDNLYLYGPPASGKSTLAQKIAMATGRRLVDVDSEIERRAGCSIPEIFAASGESAFRELEQREIVRVANEHGQVIALGGGALLNDKCRQLAAASGRVVVLDCDLDTLERRIAAGNRPLSSSVDQLTALLKGRQAHYASFSTHVRMA